MAVLSLAGTISNVQAFLAVGVRGKDAAAPAPADKNSQARVIDVTASPVNPDSANAGRESRLSEEAARARDARAATARAQVRDQQLTARRDAETARRIEGAYAYARPAGPGSAPGIVATPVPPGQHINLVI